MSDVDSCLIYLPLQRQAQSFCIWLPKDVWNFRMTGSYTKFTKAYTFTIHIAERWGSCATMSMVLSVATSWILSVASERMIYASLLNLSTSQRVLYASSWNFSASKRDLGASPRVLYAMSWDFSTSSKVLYASSWVPLSSSAPKNQY